MGQAIAVLLGQVGVPGGEGTRRRQDTRRPLFCDRSAISPSRLGKPLLCRGLSFVLRKRKHAHLWAHIGLPVDDLR